MRNNSGQFIKGSIPKNKGIKTGEYRSCNICGKLKYFRPNQIKKGFGKYCSIEHRNKDAFKNNNKDFSNKKIERCKCGQFLGNNIHKCIIGLHGTGWKGDKALYRTIHTWIRNHLGKANKCINPVCSYPKKASQGRLLLAPARFEWANVSQQYKRNLSDWMPLCPSCHKLYDHGKLIL